MRTGVRVTMIVGAAALALSAGTAGALAATTGRGGADDPPTVIEDRVGTPAPTATEDASRPTPDAVPAPGPVGDDRGGLTGGHGADDPATHDVGDDHGADDPATHDVGDDHGADNPATHDVGDDHGADDPPTHDVGDDHGGGSGHGGESGHGGHGGDD